MGLSTGCEGDCCDWIVCVCVGGSLVILPAAPSCPHTEVADTPSSIMTWWGAGGAELPRTVPRLPPHFPKQGLPTAPPPLPRCRGPCELGKC